MTLSVDDFEAFHAAVHGRQPFPWQTRLLRTIVTERAWPRLIDLPTGTGKTTCIDIALFALALDASVGASDRWCPRRIAMVVDRRVVVDQVAERGRALLRALTSADAHPVVQATAKRLRSLSNVAEAQADPLAVFTLRGGMPKDDGWARTPDQPLILASTVDQLGSRLLIQGYGVSPGMRPVHAGLLGNDLLLLLDEVHLSQPFAQTLDALDRLRTKFVSSGLGGRFQHVFLSATFHEKATTRFRLTEAEQRADSALGPRLRASKPVTLLERPDRIGVELTCIEEAQKLLTRHRVVAVVVNRVLSATRIARELRESLNARADVALLTGRMRPLDRDDVLRTLRPRIVTGRERADSDKPLVVVGTQCVEAGADFDFDALVTESASFDALRQRFGRVDRTGGYQKAEGVIVHDRSAKKDPVYGDAIVETSAWLKKVLKGEKPFDFRVLGTMPSPDEIGSMLAPKTDAPVLMPAYLDLWMQTSPPPAVVPDVALWLHGPEAGRADVQVVWRADLTERHLEAGVSNRNDGAGLEWTTAIVSAIRPSALEAISLPYAAALRWLSGRSVSDLVDVEAGVRSEEDDEGSGRLALRWNGEESEVVSARTLRPGDTIVVPATRGGIRDRCFDPDALDVVSDLAERASLYGRGRPVLRLHPIVLEQFRLALPVDDESAARERLVGVADEQGRPAWQKRWLEWVGRSRQTIVVNADESWVVLQGRRIQPHELRNLTDSTDTIEDGLDQTTEHEESSYIGCTVRLTDHCSHVERLAGAYGTALGLPEATVSDLASAGWLHDIGKADRRFQILLRGGSEIDYYKDDTPWAKSGMPVGATAAHRLAANNSGYPRGARHEMQSVAMIQQHADIVGSLAHDFDLLLYLIASHHGHGRPFAPVVFDHSPVAVRLTHVRTDGSRIDFPNTMSNHALHTLDSPLADRFWSLVEKYGWHGLCWLETILRLADHRASEIEQTPLAFL